MERAEDNDPAGQYIQLPIALLHEWSSAATFAMAVEITAKWLPHLIEGTLASVALFNDDHTELELFPLDLDREFPFPTRVPLEYTSLSEVVRSGSVLHTPDISASSLPEAGPLSQLGIKSGLCAPLVSSGKCFGSLNISRTEVDAFSDDEVANFTGLAEVLGATLSRLQQLETERNLATTDSLTGLANRRSMLDLLSVSLNESPETTHVLFLDLTGFKQVNDAYGHHTGDEMLRRIARRLESECSPRHRVGRMGGDEFLVLCGEDTCQTSARDLGKQLIDAATKPLEIGSVVLQPRLSVGVATNAGGQTGISDLLAQADRAMYRAKRSNTTVVEVDDELRREGELVARIDRELERAVADDEIEFFLQPVRDIRTGEILGAESLVRWNHPVAGFVPPPLLIERAEATDRIDMFTTWAIDKVAEMLTATRRLNPAYHDKQFAFNLSPRQLGWSDYVETHVAALERHGLIASDILIEVVESGMIEVETTAESTIRALASHGVHISLDDFGTGHNVISYFSRFPIDAIKIDRSLIAAMVDNPTVRTVVKGLTQIATELNITALGEGIETQHELDACIEVGMTVGQGYFLGRPMPFDAFNELLAFEFPGQRCANAA